MKVSPFSLFNEEKLERYLYTNNFHGVFNTKTPNLFKLLKENKNARELFMKFAQRFDDNFLDILEQISKDRFQARRKNLYLFLAYMIIQVDKDTLPRWKIILQKCLTNYEDFFDFVQCYTCLCDSDARQKFPNRLIPIVRNWYRERSRNELMEIFGNFHKRHGWTHQKLMKKAHIGFKSEEIQKCADALLYKRFPETLPQKLYNSLKLLRSQSLRFTIKMINKQRIGDVERISVKLHKNVRIWQCLLKYMDIRQVLKYLPKITAFHDDSINRKLFGALIDNKRIRAANLHPLEVFIHKNKFKNNTFKYLWGSEHSPVFPNLDRCLNKSYRNFVEINGKLLKGKKFFITIDSSLAGQACTNNKEIDAMAAACALLRFIIECMPGDYTEYIEMAVFHEKKLKFIKLEKRIKQKKMIKTFSLHKPRFILPTKPIHHALKNKLKIDYFINIMSGDFVNNIPKTQLDTDTSVPKPSKIYCAEIFKKYCKEMFLPNTKLIQFYPSGVLKSFLTESTPHNVRNIYTIMGFTLDVPRVIQSIFQGRFA